VCTSSTLSHPTAVLVSFLVCSPSFADSWLQILPVVDTPSHSRPKSCQYHHPLLYCSHFHLFLLSSPLPKIQSHIFAIKFCHLLLTLSLHLIPLAFPSADCRFRALRCITTHIPHALDQLRCHHLVRRSHLTSQDAVAHLLAHLKISWKNLKPEPTTAD
jgi:hypothetical protein